MANRSKRKGYRNEKGVAEYWSGIRLGTLGKEDVRHHVFSIETKTKPKMPKRILAALLNRTGNFAFVEKVHAFVKKAYEQAKRNAPMDKTPIVVFHVDGTKHADDICFVKPHVCTYARDLKAMVDDGACGCGHDFAEPLQGGNGE